MKPRTVLHLATMSVATASALAVGVALATLPVEEAIVVAAVVGLASAFLLVSVAVAVRLPTATARVLGRSGSGDGVGQAYLIVVLALNAAVASVAGLSIRGGRIHTGNQTADVWLAVLALLASGVDAVLAIALVPMARYARPDGRQRSDPPSQSGHR